MELNKYLEYYRKEQLSTIPIPLRAKAATLEWKPWQERLPTDEEIKRWFSNNNSNVAVVCGGVSGNLVVLDFDDELAFWDFVDKFQEKCHIEDIHQVTPVVKTGKGYHIYFKTKEPVKSQKFPRLDIKAEGGYVIAPPSIHPNGSKYQFINPNIPNIKVINSLEEIGINITQKPELPRNQPGWVTQALQGAPEGQRNDTCLRLGGYFRNKHPQDITEQLLLDWNNKNKPPLPQEEILTIIKSAYRYQPEPSKDDATKPLFSNELIEQIADTGFLESYIDYGKRQTDAPVLFHLATALAIVGTALGNGVWVRAWGKRIFPNLWIVLLAPSGFYRKSTAVNLGLEPLRKGVPDSVLPNDFTRERLIDELGKQATGIFPVYEFSEFLTKLQRDYMMGTKEMLVDLWDSPSEYKRKLKNYEVTINNPAISLLGASTIDWLEGRVSANDLRGGLFSRILFFPATTKEQWKGLTLVKDEIIFDKLSEYLTDISKLEGEADFSLIKDDLNAWIKRHEEGFNKQKIDPELIGFFSRLATYAIKLSIIMQVSTDKSLQITKSSLGKATLLLDTLKDSVISLIREDFAFTKDAKDLRRLKELIATKGGEITRSNLLNLAHMRVKYFNELLTTLHQGGEVDVYEVRTGGRPVTMIKLKEG